MSDKAVSEHIADILKQFHCPQNWNLKEFEDKESIEKITTRLENKLKGETENIENHDRFIEKLVLSYLLYNKNQLSQGLEVLDGCLQLLNVGSSLIHKYKTEFEHVLFSTKAYFFFKNDRLDSALEMVGHATANSSWTDKRYTGIMMFIKASFISHYGGTGTKKACTLITDAIQFNSLKNLRVEAEFHFLLGKLFGRIRRHDSPRKEPAQEELFHLEEAFQMKKNNPIYVLSLAKAYEDVARVSMQPKKSQYREKSSSIVRNLLVQNKKKLDGPILAICMFHLLKIPGSESEYHKLVEYAKAALEKSPNNTMVNHYVGTLYLYMRDRNPALKYLSVALTNISFVMGQVLVLKWRWGSEGDIEKFINDTLTNYQVDQHKANIYYGASEYYLIAKEDPLMAVKYFANAARQSPDITYSLSICRGYQYLNYSSVLNMGMLLLLTPHESNADVVMVKSVLAKKPYQKLKVSFKELRDALF